MSIPILMYHQIDVPPPSGTPLRGLVVSPGSFSRQMWLLKLLGYKGLSMNDLEPYINGTLQGRVVGITFDDGYRNNLENALPVLVQRGFTATCYAVSNMFGGSNSWDLSIGVAQKPLMSKEDWQVWRNAGMDIGSHTRNHTDLTALSLEAAADEIHGSKFELESRLGGEVRHFCYPYGRYDASHVDLVRRAGYITATTTHRGRVQQNADPLTLRRIMISKSTNLGLFSAKLLSSYEDQRGKPKQMDRQNKND